MLWCHLIGALFEKWSGVSRSALLTTFLHVWMAASSPLPLASRRGKRSGTLASGVHRTCIVCSALGASCASDAPVQANRACRFGQHEATALFSFSSCLLLRFWIRPSKVESFSTSLLLLSRPRNE